MIACVSTLINILIPWYLNAPDYPREIKFLMSFKSQNKIRVYSKWVTVNSYWNTDVLIKLKIIDCGKSL